MENDLSPLSRVSHTYLSSTVIVNYFDSLHLKIYIHFHLYLSCRHLFSPEAKSCLVLRSLAWKMLHIIYFDHKVNPCNGCTLRQVPLHMIPNFLTLAPGGHDSSYECDRHCWCRCDDNKYCLITTYIDWFSSLDFVSQFFFSVDFWHCR